MMEVESVVRADVLSFPKIHAIVCDTQTILLQIFLGPKQTKTDCLMAGRYNVHHRSLWSGEVLLF